MSTESAPPPADSLSGPLQRYKIMAYVTGCMLLLLCTEMVLKYVFHAGGVDASGAPQPVIGNWIAIVHGWIYVIYLVTVFLFWSAARWNLSRLVIMVAGGVVPFLSFIVEARAEQWAKTEGGRAPVAPA